MATNLQEILGRDIDSVKALKQAIRELQDSLVGLDTSSEEYKTTSEKLIAAQDALKNTTRAGIDANNAAKDSIVGMQQEYNKLYDTYKKLSDEERNSDFGKAMAENLSKLSQSINNNNKEVGNFKTNIGHYAESATEAFNKMGVSIGGLQTPLKMAAGGTKTLGTALKTLAANPIVLVITALVAILSKAAEAIKKNEELTMRLHQAMAAFQPIVDLISNALNALAGVIVKVVEGFSNFAEKIMSISPKMREQIKSHKDLAKATDDLTKATREANVENSKKQAEIERLREEASATEDVTEKKRLLEEAKRLQGEVDQTNIELAQEELRILEEYAAKTANSAEANEKLAAAQQKVNQALAEGEKNARMYNKQLGTLTNTTKGATSAGKNYREEAKKLHEQLIEDNKTELQKLTEKYEKEKKLLEKYHYDTKLLTKKYEQDVAKIQEEARLKAEEKRLERLRQARADFQREISLSDPIVGLWNKNDDLNNLIGQLDALKITLKGFGDLPEDTLISDLPSEHFKEKIDEINAAFGTSITSIKNFNLTLKEAKRTMKETFGDESKALIETYVKDTDELLYNTAFNVIRKSSLTDPIMTTLDNSLEEMRYKILEQQKKTLEIELQDFHGTQDQKIELLKRYYDIAQELRDRDMQAIQLNAERTREVMESALDFSSSIEGMMNGIEQLMQAELQSGKLTEKEAARKQKALENLQKVQLAVSIANIAANTAAGIMDVWRGYSSELLLNSKTAAAAGAGAVVSKATLDAKSLASAILRTSTLAMQGGAQIAAAVGGYISKGSAGAEGQDVGVGAAPMLIDSTPYSYTKTVQTQEEEEKLNQPIWCSIVDIENALDRQVTIKDESSF